VVDDYLKMESFEMADFEMLIKDALNKLNELLQEVNGKEEEWFYAMEKKCDIYYGGDALRLMMLLHFEQYEEAMDYINKSDSYSGGFVDRNVSLYDRVLAHCKTKTKKSQS